MTDSPFLDCEILCEYIGDEDDPLRDLGIIKKKETNHPDIFLPFCIDLREVIAIRPSADGTATNFKETDLLIFNPNVTYNWFSVLHWYGKMSVVCFAIILLVLVASPFFKSKK